MYDSEYLYFCPVASFRNPVVDTTRFDPKEGTVDEIDRSNNLRQRHICSFYQMSAHQNEIHQKMLFFGRWVLLINDRNKLLELISAQARKTELGFEYGKMNYQTSQADCYSNWYEKDRQFAYQQEFRIYLLSGITQPFYFPLPGLRSIARIVPMKSSSELLIGCTGLQQNSKHSAILV